MLSPDSAVPRDLRVLVLAPIGRDASLVAQFLRETGFECHLCEDLAGLRRELRLGCGMIFLTGEGMSVEETSCLEEDLAQQPRWSDIPLIVLTSGGSEVPANADALAALGEVGNVTLIERPVRVATLLSTVQSALRARNRQYDVRDHLAAEVRTKEELTRSEERLRVALDAAQLGAWQMEVKSGYLDCTPQCKAHFDLHSDAEFTYEIFMEKIHAEDRERVQAAIDHALAERDAYRSEYRVLTPSGNVRWLLASGRAYYDFLGEPTSIVGVTLDITRRKTDEEERERLFKSEQKARAEAENASRLKDEFLATVSHELRTPLTAILGWTHMLRTGPLEEILEAGALDTIERNARSQAQLIDDLLDVSRIVSGKLRFDIQQVDPLQVVQKAIEVVRPSADAKSIQIYLYPASENIFVTGDMDRLQQVVWNLLSNAVKFTPNGGRVEAHIEYSDDFLTISIRDNGKGIDPKFLPHVFDRFRQADQTSTRTYGGLGLGLAIVRQITELHGGTMHAESQGEGHGATFILQLPIVRPDTLAVSGVLSPRSVNHNSAVTESKDESTDESAASSLSGSLAGSRLQQLQDLKVLVVDDEKDTRDLLIAVLRQQGCDLMSAGSVAEALQVWQQWKPDILVSDIGMPLEDGYSLLKKVRSMPNGSGGEIPAIALTAYAREEDRAKALANGFQMHIAKPVEPSLFVSAIAELADRTNRTNTASLNL